MLIHTQSGFMARSRLIPSARLTGEVVLNDRVSLTYLRGDSAEVLHVAEVRDDVARRDGGHALSLTISLRACRTFSALSSSTM